MKLRRDTGIFAGSIIGGLGAFLTHAGVMGLSTILALGTGGLAAAAMGAAYVIASGTGLWMVFKGTRRIAQCLTDSNKTPAEIAFEAGPGEFPEAFTARQAGKEFNPAAAHDVKIMRPLKLGIKDTPQP